MSFRIERSATFVQVDKALQHKISRYDALFTALMRKSILRTTLLHLRYFEAIFEIFSPQFRNKISTTFVQVENALQHKISRQYALFTAFDKRHAPNVEFLDFPIFGLI
jgi:hypothetical protein